MKSHKLAKLLLEKPDVELLLQKDSEGNGYSQLCGCDFSVLVEYVDYEYEIKDSEWDAEEADMSPEEWEAYKLEHSGFAILYPY